MTIAAAALAGYIAGLFGGASAVFFVRAWERRLQPMRTLTAQAPIELFTELERHQIEAEERIRRGARRTS